ncbi:MAG: hypothetical protein RJB13_1791 [Pseudomonadota bacterium]
MNSTLILSTFAAVFIIIETVFFLACFRWLSKGKKLREREFSRLDQERAELVELQAAVAGELSQAKKISEETLTKLRKVGSDAHEEWLEMTKRCETLLVDIEAKSKDIVNDAVAKLNKTTMQIEKSTQIAMNTSADLKESTQSAQKLLRFLDESVPSDEIFKELQAEKYAEARRLIFEGAEVNSICRKLGLSQSEVQLLSYMG